VSKPPAKAVANEHGELASDDNEPEPYKAEVGGDKKKTQRENTQDRAGYQGKPEVEKIAHDERLAKEQQDLFSKLPPLSKTPCKSKALTCNATQAHKAG
jgi:hypothetical protein